MTNKEVEVDVSRLTTQRRTFIPQGRSVQRRGESKTLVQGGKGRGGEGGRVSGSLTF